MARGLVLKKEGFGEPVDMLELVDTLEKPTAAPGFVVVYITVRPVNPTDFLAIRGHYRKSSPKGTVIGSEGFGIVDNVGEGVTKVKVGQRVTPLVANFNPDSSWSGTGAMQEYVTVPEENVYAIPDTISDEVAAQFFINPWTAYGMIEQLQVQPGEYILQTAAGSALGRMVIQLAKHYGFKTINVVRRDELKEELKNIGADEVINSSTEDVVAKVKEITGGKGAFAAIDAVAGESTRICGASVRNGGTVFIYGLLSSDDVKVDILDLFRLVQVRGFIVFKYVADRKKRDEVAVEVLKLLEQKVITTLTGKSFAFKDFKEACIESEKKGRGGKVFIVT